MESRKQASLDIFKDTTLRSIEGAKLINLANMDEPVTVLDTYHTLKVAFFKDDFYLAEKVLKHFETLLTKNLVVTADNHTPLTAGAEEVKAFMESEEVTNIR